MKPLDALVKMLKPAGGGLHLVSAGRQAQVALQQRLYGVASEHEVAARHQQNLARLDDARVVILGIPSDVGAGFLRGANLGPQAVREALLTRTPGWASFCEKHRVVDLGDVFTVPQLLSDEMLSAAQIAASRRALYPDAPDADLPVSPLSIAERVLDVVLARNPRAKPFVLGGDHSVAWPVTQALFRARQERWGIVQVDAHTDLLESRLGVRICFGTWSFHAAKLLGPGRLVQVGTRSSRHDRSHWEATTGVRQFWATACRAEPAKAVDDLVAALRSAGVTHLYFTNDIDGTDSADADATGTPEPDGLSPAFVEGLIRRLGRDFELVAGDLVEVAPLLARSPGGTEKTLALAARYARATLETLVGAVP